LTVGTTAKLAAVARSAEGTPRSDVPLELGLEQPGRASVDAAGVVTAIAPGQAKITTTAVQWQRHCGRCGC